MSKLGLKLKRYRRPKVIPRGNKPPKLANGLTPRHMTFVAHYIETGNKEEAAIKAGYSPGSAHVRGHLLIKSPQIKAEIDRRMSKIAEKQGITAERIIAEIGKIAFCDMRNFLGPDGLPVQDFSKLSPDDTAAMASITVEEFTDGRSDKRQVRRMKFTLRDKEKALEMLCKRFGLFKDAGEGNDNVSVLGLLLREIEARERAQIGRGGGLLIEHGSVK